jgi:hypothetical protein
MRKVIVLEHISMDGVIQAPADQRKIPAAFKVTEGIITPSGVIVVNYERAGAITIGNV